jgi:hypothetical protein
MRAMMSAVVIMGVLIVVGVATLGITIFRRLAVPLPSGGIVLNEPAGTRMLSVTQTGDRLAVLLQGGGPDRIVLLDARSGAVSGRIALAQ